MSQNRRIWGNIISVFALTQFFCDNSIKQDDVLLVFSLASVKLSYPKINPTNYINNQSINSVALDLFLDRDVDCSG